MVFSKTEISWIYVNLLNQRHGFFTPPYEDNYDLWEDQFGTDYFTVIFSVICWIDEIYNVTFLVILHTYRLLLPKNKGSSCDFNIEVCASKHSNA